MDQPANMSSDPAPGHAAWRDLSLDVAARVAALMAEMTVEEKVAQLYGVWVGADASGAGVAPHQHDLAGVPAPWVELVRPGLGQLTRPFGTAPVDPLVGARGVAQTQRDIVAASRFGVPAMVHEECLTGAAVWQATVYPAPLSWGATFDPDLVCRMGAAIGSTLRSLGVHQGLAPVLDVTRDLRWGRVEETIGEDPHLVGLVGSAYVRGLESAGVVATLKHFVGYSASRAGRNLAPVSAGPRELADVLLPPFEMALRAGARSVMNSYSDVDGVPVAADPTLLTDLLRGTYGFTGTVVADYFSVTFLQTLHGVAGDKGDAARQALQAGIDVELPTVSCFGEPLLKAIEAGEVDLAPVDRAVERVLRQKCELGLLDPDWSASPPILDGDTAPDLDDPDSRALARLVAERAVVLLRNDGTLPLAAGAKVALVGPQAAAASALMGCYSFPMHVSLLGQSSGAEHSGGPLLLLSPPSLLLVVGSTAVVVSPSLVEVLAVVSSTPIVVSMPVPPIVPIVSSPGVVLPGMVVGVGPDVVEPDASDSDDVVLTSAGGGVQAAPSSANPRGSVRRVQEVMGSNPSGCTAEPGKKQMRERRRGGPARIVAGAVRSPAWIASFEGSTPTRPSGWSRPSPPISCAKQRSGTACAECPRCCWGVASPRGAFWPPSPSATTSACGSRCTAMGRSAACSWTRAATDACAAASSPSAPPRCTCAPSPGAPRWARWWAPGR